MFEFSGQNLQLEKIVKNTFIINYEMFLRLIMSSHAFWMYIRID